MLLHTLRYWFSNIRRSQRTRRRTNFANQFESLETRQVLSVVGLTPMSPVLQNGVLTVIGDGNNNTIEVTKSGDYIKVLGKSFRASLVQKIVIDGQGGNDTINVSESITQKTVLYGGSGNDIIRGGAGVDVIYGGSGSDTIYGRGGNDKIYGGSGSDTIDGGAGSDSVLDFNTGDRVTSASTLIHESSTLTAYLKSSYTGQVVNEVLRLINVERAKLGRKAVTLDAALNSVASDYAKLLRAMEVPIGQGISHAFSGHDRPTLGSRLNANQVTYSTAKENNAFRKNSSDVSAEVLARQIMDSLMSSSGHRANILSADVTKVGLGLAGSTSSGYYMTQVFTG